MASPSNLPPVLVVDDSPDDLILIKRLLVKAEIRNPVVTFDDPVKAVAFLKVACANPDSGLLPAVLLTDLKMPVMDGFEIIQWVRKQKALARLHVVVLSTSSLEIDLERAKAAGTDHYLPKYPKPDALAKLLDGPCSLRSKR